MSLAVPTSGWLDEQRKNLARATINTAAQDQVALEALREAHDLLRAYLLTSERGKAIGTIWGLVCDSISELSKLHGNKSNLLEQFCELARTVLIDRPDLNLVLPARLEEVVWTVRVSPLAYLRAMVNLFWSAVRHPLSETTIDLSTGRVLYRN